MAYWWVNHKQTFSNEIEGGYIWSPKENSNGSRNQTYINLTLTRPGDIVFSYASGKIKAIGVVTSSWRESKRSHLNLESLVMFGLTQVGQCQLTGKFCQRQLYPKST